MTTDPRVLLGELEQRARRRFGQHFLQDRSVVSRMIRGARVKPGDHVVEVGPGLGILTAGLVAAGANVTAVELDRDLAAFMRRTYPEVNLVEADAAKVNWPELLGNERVKMVANLPYNVGTKVVMQCLRLPSVFASVTVMLQLEVVHRFCAEPGNKSWGALSVEAQARAKPTFVMKLSPDVFHPPPKVNSAVVRFDLFEEPQVGDVTPKHFDRVVRAGFSQRRKTAKNALGSLFGREEAAAAIARLGLPPDLRAEQLDLQGFRDLAAALA